LDRSVVERIARRELEPLKEKLGIPHWDVMIVLEDIEDRPDTPRGQRDIAESIPHPPYNQARIGIDPDQIEDEEHLLKVIRHELFHILLSPYRVYRHVQSATIRAGSPADEQEDRLWRYCDEQAVINLERMHRGLTAGAHQAPPVARKRRR
jgi:cobalamin biosynthesis protein CbiG